MANNGGRQGAGANGQMSEHVEFTVKAEEDLFLTGTENTIRRVTAETNYSCLMLKTQRFSSLFRHYAKYHGLRKDDLEYYFVSPLENEDTPESVQLQRGDTIMVRKRRKPEPPEAASDDDEFFKDLRALLEDEEHMDAIFLVPNGATITKNNNSNSNNSNEHTTLTKKKGEPAPDRVISNSSNNSANSSNAGAAVDMDDDVRKNMVEIRAHKCILTARTDYFKAFFRTGATPSGGSNSGVAFRESHTSVIPVEPHFAPLHIRYMLEFVYTNRIHTLGSISTDDLLCLLHLSDKWLLRDMKRLIEHELIRHHVDVQTVARLYGATEDYHAQRLAKHCVDFIMENLRQVTGSTTFEEEMKNYPHLCIPVLKAAAEMMPEGPLHKKQRTDHASAAAAAAAATPATGAAALGSSPVPDLDP